MASLQSSCCTVLAANPHHRFSPFPQTLPSKPSHLLPNERRSRRRSHVSCNGGGEGKPSAEGRVDRRNMLLGLGGLYGAANLISDPNKAYAAPIEPPVLKKCGEARELQSDDPLDVNCCPPVSDTIIDYELPSVKKLRVRPAAHMLNREYLGKYEEAIRRMKALDKTDPDDPRGFTQQANIHCAYCNGAYNQVGYGTTDISIHFSWLFFPFHRWYLYFYERILGSLICDPNFALPFWNWDNPPGMRLPEIFDNPNSPLYDVNRNPCHRPPQMLDLSLSYDLDEDEQKVIMSNLSIVSHEMRRVDHPEDFMGQPYRAGDTPPAPPKGGTVERGSHTAVHRWVGDPMNKYHEDLGNFYSAGRDPAFFSHHANVDRMWTIWTHMNTNVAKTIDDPDYLNASFLFYDENKQLVRVKVADSLDNMRMGYAYQRAETPWLYYTPPKKAGRVKIQNISKGVLFPDKVFPLTLNKITRVLVSKTAKGKADEVLVLEDIETDPTMFIKFDVYVNDEDDAPKDVDRAEYAGSFSQLPHRVHSMNSKGSIKFSLKELYEDIDIADDDKVVVTIVPKFNGHHVTIGGIKIVESSSKPAAEQPGIITTLPFPFP